jgi:general secretion pathway protein G
MIELIFVIVVLGVLAAVAVPKFAATREDAQISKGAADIASIRSGIVSVRQKYLLRGQTDWLNKLSDNPADQLFDGNGTSGTEVLMYPIAPKNAGGHWRSAGTDADCEYYLYKVGTQDCKFCYDNDDGTFNLDAGSTHDFCKALVGE